MSDLISLYSWVVNLKRADRATDLQIARLIGWYDFQYDGLPEWDWEATHPLDDGRTIVPFFTKDKNASFGCLPNGWSLEYFEFEDGRTSVTITPDPDLNMEKVALTAISFPIAVCAVSILALLVSEIYEYDQSNKIDLNWKGLKYDN